MSGLNRRNDSYAHQFMAGGLIEVYARGRPKLRKRLLQLCGFNLGLLTCHMTVVVGRQRFDASKIGQAYPRVYGGTLLCGMGIDPSLNISPCVRGNPPDNLLVDIHDHHIPVCTGEPFFGVMPATVNGGRMGV